MRDVARVEFAAKVNVQIQAPIRISLQLSIRRLDSRF